MNIRNRIEHLLKKAKTRFTKFEIDCIPANETRQEARRKAQLKSNTVTSFVNVYPADMNNYKYVYLCSLPNYKELHETKSIIQILDEHRATITDPDELKKWDSLPGEKV